MKRCKKCILPENYPGIEFNSESVCNYCLNFKKYRVKGIDKLKEIVEKYKKNGKEPDCVVPISGGRDSSFALHHIVRTLGMKPICVTYDWGKMTPIAHRNWEKFTKKLNVRHVVIIPDVNKINKHIRMNVQAWLKKPHLGMVPIFTQADKQAVIYVSKVARENNIRLVLTGAGNNMESIDHQTTFFGVKNGFPEGDSANISLQGKIKLALRYGWEYIRNPGYINSSIIPTIKSAIALFTKFAKIGTEWFNFYDYYLWEENEVVATLRREYDWETPNDTKMTWRIDDATPPFYNYLHYTIAGFTEFEAFRSNQIRQGVLTREEALKLVEEENKPRYGAIKDYLDSIELNYDEVMKKIDEIPKTYDKIEYK